jgi:hypothetical protein
MTHVGFIILELGQSRAMFQPPKDKYELGSRRRKGSVMGGKIRMSTDGEHCWRECHCEVMDRDKHGDEDVSFG